MNAVELVRQQLGGGMIGKLSSLIGEDEVKTGSAVNAAVPSLLSALAGQVSNGDGAQRVASTLSGLDPGLLGNLGGMLTSQAGSLLQEKGTSLLSSIFGGSTVSSIISSVSHFAGLGPSAVRKLLGFLTPAVLGGVASQFRGKAITPKGLAGFFSDQASTISTAFPSGFSLEDATVVASPTAAARHAVGTAKGAGAASGRWLIPVLGLGLLALLGWRYLGSTMPSIPMSAVGAPTPTAFPNAAQLASDLTTAYSNSTSVLSGITDVESARAALPKLTDLSVKLDSLKGVWDTLPDPGRSTIRAVTTSHLGKFRELINKLWEIPGVSSVIKPTVDQIVAKFSGFGA